MGSEGSDQTAQMCSLIRAVIVHLQIHLIFLFVLRFTAQSTQWGHVQHGQFT